MKLPYFTFRRAAPALALLALSLGAAPAHADFVVNTDGTVTDDATGLIWDQCAYGLSGSGCDTGTASTYTWQNALKLAVTANTAQYKGHNDWRLPNVKELESLVDIGRYNPAIDTTVFPRTPSGRFWSSSVYTPDAALAWNVNFGSGGTGANGRGITYRVRLVRGGQSFDLLNLYTVGGSVTGLAGSGLVLKMGTQTAAISANGAYAFANGLATNTGYTVTVQTQPTNPPQTCAVSNASGTVGTAHVINVAVNCVTNAYTVSGAASPPEGGSVTCPADPVTHGQTAQCGVSVNPGYTLSGARSDTCGGSLSGGSFTTGAITAACTVTATFTRDSYAIATPPTTGGSVTCTPAAVHYDESSTCTAQAAAGYVFSAFGGDCAGTTGTTCTLTGIRGNRTVTASFALVPAVTPVPTLGQWGLMLLGLLAAGLGARRLRRGV